MIKIKNLLEARYEELLNIKKEKEQDLKTAIHGGLRINHRGDSIQYYWRDDTNGLNGAYIKKQDLDVAKRLAQKSYDKIVLSMVNSELVAIEKYMDYCPKIEAERVFETLSQDRKRLVKPILESDEDYINSWLECEYKKKEFYDDSPEYYTAKGERVRSKSEVIIADMLYRKGIPYIYEKPLYLKGVGNVHPDFTVLDVKNRREVYWEHFGMMDSIEYSEKAIRKITSYQLNNYIVGNDLIFTFESYNMPLNQKIIKRNIENYFI